MKINKVNAPAFGCGACATMKKVSLKHFEVIKKINPESFGEMKANDYYKYLQGGVKADEKVGLSHGKAASKMYKELKQGLGL